MITVSAILGYLLNIWPSIFTTSYQSSTLILPNYASCTIAYSITPPNYGMSSIITLGILYKMMHFFWLILHPSDIPALLGIQELTIPYPLYQKHYFPFPLIYPPFLPLSCGSYQIYVYISWYLIFSQSLPTTHEQVYASTKSLGLWHLLWRNIFNIRFQIFSLIMDDLNTGCLYRSTILYTIIYL